MSAAEEFPKSGRLRRADLRMSEERLRRYQQAAALEETSFSAFALRALDAAAEETLRRHRTITLSEEGMRAFVDDLLNPGVPGERLKRYAEMHRKMVSEQSGRSYPPTTNRPSFMKSSPSA